MSVYVENRSDGVVRTALAAAVEAADGRHTTVSIWVVWMRGRRVLGCASVTRLDCEMPVSVPSHADGAVVAAVAPLRVAWPVVERVNVIADYLETRGLRVRPVHVYALHEGAMWTSLRGTTIAGTVPASPRPGVPRRHGWLPRLGVGWRMLGAAIAPLAALMFALPVAYAGPAGQPGVSPPPQPGQAGVTAPVLPIGTADSAPISRPVPDPSLDEPPASTPEAEPESLAISPPVAEQSATGPSAAGQVAVETSAASPSSWRRGPEASADSDVTGDDVVLADPVSPVPEPDVVRLGGVEVPRPEWLPVEVAADERRWNDFLAGEAASVLDQAGVSSAASDTVLGVTGEDEAAPMPPEWEPVAAVLPDPVPLDLPVEVSEPVAAAAGEIVPQLAHAVESVLLQSGLPVG
ncbi:hypothetical protein [Nocardia wallacei]|uniref:hypothetical protein n=1 Tax=Nocardia wallacei TaxID=480035 RepID=UPI0024585CD9|nr:hypothetical protein [Nocardia wallacei]